MGRANVAAVYLVHGTFCGNDVLGLWTELSRVAPRVSEKLRRITKRIMDLLLGESGNYTRRYAQRMEMGLSAGAGRTIPVRLFHWSSQNNHIARADGAVRLIDELATCVESSNFSAPHPRILLWGHSHGGNVFALTTQLLGGDQATRTEFFDAARPFYQRRSGHIDFPTWRRVQELLAANECPLQATALDFVTFGTPIRYGWETDGYSKLMHIHYHRPVCAERDWLAPYPPRLLRALTAGDGDFMEHLGIAGSGFPPNPLAFRTLAANRRLRRLLAANVSKWLFTNLKAGMRVPDDGDSLLIDYAESGRIPLKNVFGHVLYTRSRWLPLHCELVAQQFYAGGM